MTSLSIVISNKTINLKNQPVQLRILIISLIVFVALCLPLTTGGDHFGGFRFYQDILLLCVWAIPSVILLYKESFLEKLKYPVLSLQVIVVLFFVLIGSGMLFNLKRPLQSQLDFEFNIANEQRVMAEEMNSLWPDSMHHPSVGVIFAGSFALIIMDLQLT